MAAIWGKAILRELCELTSSKRIYAADYRSEGLPFYRGKEIIEKQKGNLEISTKLFISETKFLDIKRKFGAPQAGELLLTSVGTLGVPYLVRPGEKFYFKDGNLTWFRRLRSLDSHFLYYWLLSPEGKAELKKCTIDTSQSALTIVLLKNMEIQLPPLPTQRKIAEILSAYDDLIENNTRRIRILEEMAQAIYREWFVHFRFPGHKKVKRVPSPLGPLPEGWSVVKLAKVAEINALSVQRGEEPEEIAYVDIASVSPGSIDEAKQLKFKDAPGRARRIVRHGDTIWSMVRPNRRSFALVLDPVRNMIVSTGFAVVSAAAIPFSYLYHTLTTDEFVGYLANRATGAAYPAVKAEDFENAEVLRPDKMTLAHFDDLVLPMIEGRNSLAKKNRNLHQTRDLLLPKLISGELDVSDLDIRAEKTV